MRDSIGHVDHLIRFGGQKVKGQGHSGSNKGQNLTFLALMAEPLEGFRPNVGER